MTLRVSAVVGGGPSAAPEAPVDIAILAKAPLAGFSKTRLIPLLGAQGAADLQRCLLRRAVQTACAAQLGKVILWGAPDLAHAEFECCAARWPVQLCAQPALDLGGRMLAAVAHTPLSIGTLVIGTDCPRLSPALLRAAADQLRTGQDAVLVPAEDGGYVLIGMKAADARVFSGVAWGSAQVMEQTRSRLLEIGWRWAELPTLWDVDLPDDYARLVRELPEVLDEVSTG